MSFTLGLSLGVTRQSGAGTPAPPPTNSRTADVTDFPTDNLTFDSGYLRGPSATDRNLASIPLSGSVFEQDGITPITADAVIEARASLVDASGSTAWQEVANPLTGATAWSGTISLPRSASRYLIEVRVQGSSEAANAMTTNCAVGHVIVLLGQSEHQRIGDGNQQSALTTPTVAAEGRVRVAWRPNDEADPVEWTVVSNATPHSPAVAAYANALHEMRPGDHFTVIFQTKGATNLQQLANDAITDRNWSADLNIINAGTGNQITGFGMVALDWTAGPGTWGTDYAAVFGRFFTKRLPDGSAMSAGDTYNAENGADTITFDHYWADLDATVPVLPFGPHRFETETSTSDPAGPQQVFENAETDENGMLIGPMALKRMTRASMKTMKDYPNGNFWPKGLSPLLYRNGDAGSTIPWSDYAHPGKIDNNQGLPLWAQQNAYVLGQMIGWEAITPPVIEAADVTWAANGSSVSIDIGQTLSTYKLEEGDPSTAVAGFEVSGRPASAVASGGVITINHPDGTFTANDNIKFGMGGASGVITFIDDIADEIWKEWPMVPRSFTAEYDAAGSTNLGIALEPVTDWLTVFKNPLALPSGSSSVTDVATQFVDNSFPDRTSTPWSGTTNKLTMRIKFNVASAFSTSAYHVFGSYGTLAPVSLSVHGSNGRVRTRFGDSTNTSGGRLIDTNAHTITYGVDTTLLFAVDISDTANGKAWLRDENDNLLWSASGLSTNGEFGRDVFYALAGNFIGTLFECTFWNDCAVDGTALPLTDAYRVVAGGASLLNNHEWHDGPNVS